MVTAVLTVQLSQLSDVYIPRSVVSKLVVHEFVVNLPLFPIELIELRFLKFRLISRIYRPKMVRGRIIVRP